MSFHTTTSTRNYLTHTTADGREIELNLYHQPDCVMDYKDQLVFEKNNKVLVGYLVQDTDCPNPLEDCDGMGHIYTAHRGSGTHREMQQALGLNHDWAPDIDDDAVFDHAIELIREAHKQHFTVKNCISKEVFTKMVEWAEDNFIKAPGETSLGFVLECLGDLTDLEDFLDIEELRHDWWKRERAAGRLGNKYAVVLDVYEHGGVAYSLSGQGMQCQWDTARGGAVWVPDFSCEEEIKRRGWMYRKGNIINAKLRTHELVTVRTFAKAGLYDDKVHPNFEHWEDAFQYLSKLELEPGQYLQPLDVAEYDAAKELAKQACEVYTDWCNGNCFGIVVETFNLEGVPDGAELDGEEEDSCWGFVGDDYAYQELKSSFDSAKESL